MLLQALGEDWSNKTCTQWPVRPLKIAETLGSVGTFLLPSDPALRHRIHVIPLIGQSREFHVWKAMSEFACLANQRYYMNAMSQCWIRRKQKRADRTKCLRDLQRSYWPLSASFIRPIFP